MHLRPSALPRFLPRTLPGLLALAFALTGLSASAQNPAPARPSASAPAAPAAANPPDRGPGVVNSSMDASLFYQLLISEVQARQGDLGTGYQLYLDAAKRHRSGQLFQRAVEIALQARAGEQALAAAQAWRLALPKEREAAEYTAQILMAMGRITELADPMQSLVRLADPAQRPQVIAALPRSLNRLPDRKAAAEVVDEATEPWRTPLPGMAEAWAASSEAWLYAGEIDKAHAALLKAHAANPRLLTVALLALDIMAQKPEVESMVTAQLGDKPPLVLRLAYARRLAVASRLEEAGRQLDAIVAEQPDNGAAWLTLAAVRLELKQTDAAEVAVSRFLALPPPAPQADSTSANTPEPEQGYLLMAQISENRGQHAKADEWLRKADPQGQKLKIQAARARLLASQGKLEQARALVRAVPDAEPRDALARISAEVQLLREARRFEDAYKVLEQANQRYPDDPDLLYEQAMLAERLTRFDDVERLLKRVIELKPDHSHAYNALGYSLADRGVRLDEARALIGKALELRPGDPFITDSLGWLEFRAGRPEEALKWLRQAYVVKADAEIAAHLGEVLWTQGQREEALRIWREGVARDARNETLQDTLKRLKVSL